MARWTGRRVAEAVGIIGVIGSLTFVGGELRQHVIATRAAADAEVSNAFVDLNLMLAWNPHLARAFAQHANDPASAPLEAQILMLGSWPALFHIWSNVHRPHINGPIDPAIYESFVQEISTYAVGAMEQYDSADLPRGQALIHWAWENERFIYNVDFQNFVDELLSSTQYSEPAGRTRYELPRLARYSASGRLSLWRPQTECAAPDSRTGAGPPFAQFGDA